MKTYNHPVKFFLAGIIQGSSQDMSVHQQSYRDVLKPMLQDVFPDAHILCPVSDHPNSVAYSDEKAGKVFHYHLDEVRKSDCLIVYLPEASMGSAIEMWIAYEEKIPIITISPMITNWVIRLLSTKNVANLDEFIKLIKSGKLFEILEANRVN